MGSRLLTALALAGATAALASCGGGGASEVQEVQEVREMLRESADEDPSNCTRYQTLAYTEQLTKEHGRAAIRSCEEEVVEREDEPGSFDIVRLRADDGAARLRASFDGSVLDGQTLEFALVEVDGDWKLDRIVGFVELDRAEPIAELGVSLIDEMPSPFGARLTACVVDRLEGLSSAELENLILGPSWRPLESIAETCVPGESPARAA